MIFKSLSLLSAIIVLALSTSFAAFAEDTSSTDMTAAIVPEKIIVADATPLSADEMGELRGGFLDLSGLFYNFSVNVQTALNGAEIFTRNITVAPGLNGQLQATTTSNIVTQNIPASYSVTMIGNGQGVSITNQAGSVTTAVNQTAAGAPASIIVNNNSNLKVTQGVGLNLTLPNLAYINQYVQTVTRAAAMAQQRAVHSLGL